MPNGVEWEADIIFAPEFRKDVAQYEISLHQGKHFSDSQILQMSIILTLPRRSIFEMKKVTNIIMLCLSIRKAKLQAARGKNNFIIKITTLARQRDTLSFPFSKLVVGMQLLEFMKTWITSLQGLFQGSLMPKFQRFPHVSQLLSILQIMLYSLKAMLVKCTFRSRNR